MNQQVSNVTPMRTVDLTNKQLALVRRTLASDCNDDEFNLFCEVARRMNADPFKRHLYALVFSKDDPKKRRMSIVTGIDFYRTVAARNGDYRPDEAKPFIHCDEKLKSDANPLGIEYCEVRTYKFAHGAWFPVVGVAYWAEYCPTELDADEFDWIDTGEVWPDSGRPKKKKVPKGATTEKPKGKWLTMPRVMIAKCAEANGLRKGWPEDLSGVYVEEELDRSKAEDMTAAERADKAAEERRLLAVGAHNAIMITWGGPLEPVPLGQFADKAMEYIHTVRTSSDLIAWRDTNLAPMREFWAKQKGDALEVNRAVEARIKELQEREKAIG